VGADVVSVLEMPSWSPVRRWRLLVAGMPVAHAPVVSRETASRSSAVRVLQECVDRADCADRCRHAVWPYSRRRRETWEAGGEKARHAKSLTGVGGSRSAFTICFEPGWHHD